MQAYYEIETEIPSNHQLNIQLPDTIPAGRAGRVQRAPTELPPDNNSRMADFLNSCQTNRRGALHAPNSTIS